MDPGDKGRENSGRLTRSISWMISPYLYERYVTQLTLDGGVYHTFVLIILFTGQHVRLHKKFFK